MDRATRLVLWNQFEILRKLNPHQERDYEQFQDVLASGYTSQYSEMYGHIEEFECDAATQSETMDILDMFRALDRAMVEGWSPADKADARFEGFDGNNDPHFHFARFILDVRGLYSESAPNKNSHSTATLARYRRMLEAWKKLPKQFGLDSTQADTVVSA